uniref:Uncharacterized protein n=1 Tax=Arion vulgaris TaxID=1028688 RepID=A0A0B6YAE9_9EUPU
MNAKQKKSAVLICHCFSGTKLKLGRPTSLCCHRADSQQSMYRDHYAIMAHSASFAKRLIL